MFQVFFETQCSYAKFLQSSSFRLVGLSSQPQLRNRTLKLARIYHMLPTYITHKRRVKHMKHFKSY